MRGKLTINALSAADGGLIPACAGKTEGGSKIDEKTRGSSPRVRGKLRPDTIDLAGTGLIPACAGKTARHSVRGPRERAHPRVCGENHLKVDHLPAITGSSPRVRGKRVGSAAAIRLRGLIPACAGKTGLESTARAL